MAQFKLKAMPNKKAKAVIVSFDARWRTPLEEGKIGVVFRKKAPTTYLPEYLYAYMSSPLSAIVARMVISRIERMSGREAVKYCEDGSISEEELRKYCATTDEVFVIWTGAPSVARKPVTMQTLMADYDFCPTPNFVSLSDEGCRVIDRLGYFEEGMVR